MNKNKELYCLIGYPVSHSLSPAIHNSAFRESRIKGIYTTMLVKPGELEDSISTLRRLNVKGINVTMPHKETVIRFVEEMDEVAGEIGAVNTIVNENGKLKGYNTDAVGAVEAVRSIVDELKGKRAVILGRGGMSRAVAFGLKQEGMKISQLGRDEMKVENLSSEIGNADLVCNCTPLGTSPGTTPIPKRLLKKELAIFDAVYINGKTDLIRDAASVGCKTVDGVQMLVNQGANSFRLWTGTNPNRELMLKEARKAMNINKKRRVKSIYFVGFMGSGKSSVGKEVARELGKRFVDTDDELSYNHSRTVREIFDAFGEEKFRKMEQKEIERLSKKDELVVASGGGSVLDYENIARMKDHGTLIFLRAEASTIFERLRGDESRPLLKGTDGTMEENEILRVLNARMPYYEFARDIEIITDEKSVYDVAKEAIKKLDGLK